MDTVTMFLLDDGQVVSELPEGRDAAKHVKISHSIPHAAAAAPLRDEHDEGDDGTQPWMMLPVGLAAIGFAVRRQQRALDSLQPQIN